jgi:hypothetical protein
MPINNEAIDIEEDEIPEGLDELLDETLTAMEIQDKFEEKEKAKKFVSKSFAAPSLKAKPKVKRAKIKSSKLLDKGPKDLQGVGSDEKLVGGINDNLTRVSESLGAIEQVLRQQFGLEKSETEKDARSAALEKAKEREEKLEGKKKVQKDRKSALKAITPPAIGFFDTLKNYFKNILIGGALLGIINWFKDPENQKKIDEFKTFVTENLGKIITGVAVAALAIIAIPILPTILSLTTMLLAGLPILAKLIAFVATPLGLKALAIAVVGASALALFRKIDENIAGGKVMNEFEDALRKELDDVGGIKLAGGGTGAVLLDEKGDKIELPVFDLPNATEPSIMGRKYDPNLDRNSGVGRNERRTLNLDNKKVREFILRSGNQDYIRRMAAYDNYKSEMARKETLRTERDREIGKITKQIQAIEESPGAMGVGNKRTDLSDAEKAEIKRLRQLSDQVYEDYNNRLMRDATAPALTTPEENIFLKGYEDFKRQSQGFYDESMRRIDQINEFLQPPDKKSPEVSFLPLGAASETPTSAAAATQTSVPVFSAADSSAPYSMAVRSIYNMVNA